MDKNIRKRQILLAAAAILGFMAIEIPGIGSLTVE